MPRWTSSFQIDQYLSDMTDRSTAKSAGVATGAAVSAAIPAQAKPPAKTAIQPRRVRAAHPFRRSAIVCPFPWFV